MRIFYFLALLVASNFSYAQENVTKTPVPSWVNKINFLDKTVSEDNGGYQYLLIDKQNNLINESLFRHYIISLINSDGVQSMSDISVVFDPAFQKVEFHAVHLIRDGKPINKLEDSKIQLIQREESMERSLYDGTVTAVIHLTDVRKNDLIEYSYSIIGFNPIYKGTFTTNFYQQFTIPINRIYNRILTNSNKEIQFKLVEGAEKPTVIKRNNSIDYIWDQDGLQTNLYDNNVPIWYDTQKRINISTFKNWEEVVKWALPLYKVSKTEKEKTANSIRLDRTEKENILEIIRIVQDDIRYLGFESGIGGYKPNSPLKVLNQRYGDCKDKSLLLITLLQANGIEAFPLLVNTKLKGNLKAQLPSNNVFDHCVVNFNYLGNEYYIDPTISGQGGDLSFRSFPNYQYGLLIKPDQKQLIKLPENQVATLKITELISIDSIGGSAGLIVRSEYTGSQADDIRTYFNSTTKEAIQKEYLNFYSNLYPSIELADEIKLYDYDRNSTNNIIVEEYYHVKEFWVEYDDQSFISFETYPLVLESKIGYPNSAKRRMPYYLGEPLIFSQNTQIDLPEDWPSEKFELHINGDGFEYSKLVNGRGSSLSVTHKYNLKKEYISSDSVDTFLKKHDKIKNEFSHQLTYNQNLAEFKLSWVSVFMALITTAIAVFGAFRVYNSFSPAPLENAKNLSIGGWLVLPAIGVSISPIVHFVQVVSNGHFNQNTWVALQNQSNALVLLVGAELIYNFLFLTFSVLIVVLFYQRKTSLPKLISIYYLLAFVVPLIDMFLVEQLVPNQQTSASDYKEIGRSIIVAIIWIPYFNISGRVKNTFCISASSSKKR